MTVWSQIENEIRRNGMANGNQLLGQKENYDKRARERTFVETEYMCEILEGEKPG